MAMQKECLESIDNSWVIGVEGSTTLLAEEMISPKGTGGKRYEVFIANGPGFQNYPYALIDIEDQVCKVSVFELPLSAKYGARTIIYAFETKGKIKDAIRQSFNPIKNAYQKALKEFLDLRSERSKQFRMARLKRKRQK